MNETNYTNPNDTCQQPLSKPHQHPYHTPKPYNTLKQNLEQDTYRVTPNLEGVEPSCKKPYNNQDKFFRYAINQR